MATTDPFGAAAKAALSEAFNAPTVSGTELQAAPGKPTKAIVLRASASVWSFEEPEGELIPGEPRPYRVIDEPVVMHLSNTGHELTHEILRHEVVKIVKALDVPVDVRLVKARWLHDVDKEERERVVASLGGGHRFSDVKMLLGVDYLGKWATIHMALAMEPERIPEAPPPPAETSYGFAIAIFIGAVAMAMTGAGSDLGYGLAFLLLAFMGVPAAALVAFMTYQANETKKANAKKKWEREQNKRIAERDLNRAIRSFKVDDLRLFRKAMEEVFKQVTDGIKERGGVVVQRIEGAHGMLGAGRAPTGGDGLNLDADI